MAGGSTTAGVPMCRLVCEREERLVGPRPPARFGPLEGTAMWPRFRSLALRAAGLRSVSENESESEYDHALARCVARFMFIALRRASLQTKIEPTCLRLVCRGGLAVKFVFFHGITGLATGSPRLSLPTASLTRLH